MRIGVEARRTSGSGIGRVTALVCSWLASSRAGWEVLAFGPPSATSSLPKRVRRVPWEASPFSEQDIHGLPALVQEHGLDLFISLQFYTSPYLSCRHIRFVHDLWPLQLPHLGPSYAEMYDHFGRENIMRAFRQFAHEHAADETAVHRLLSRMYEAAVSSADVVVTVSHQVKRQLLERWPEIDARLNVIYPVPTRTSFPSSRATPSATRARIGDYQPYILHVGNWEPRKNQVLLLHALERARTKLDTDIRLVMVGDDVGAYRGYSNELRKVVTTASANGWLWHVGKPDDASLKDLYRGARLVVQPSLDEGFGLPAFEAMSLGTPVVVSTAGALPEICGDAAFYAEPNDVESMAIALASCWADEGLRARLSRAGHHRARAFVSMHPHPREQFLSVVAAALRRQRKIGS